jgi:excisionase family DNA binding protein
MARAKEILTTGQVADICKVAPRTVTKWFDSGRLKGYKIPGSRDRRIPLSELRRFMKEYSIPTDKLEFSRNKALVIAHPGEKQMALVSQLERFFEVQTACSSFDAGLVIPKFMPDTVFISLLSPDIDANAICQNIRNNPELAGIKVIAVADSLTRTEESTLLHKGFSACHTANDGLEGLIRSLEQIRVQLA